MTGSHNPTSDSTHTPELMYIRCATCGVWIDVKPGNLSGVTHGMCDGCFRLAMNKLDREDAQGGAPHGAA